MATKFFTAIANMEIEGRNNIYSFFFQSRKQYVYTDEEWMFREYDELAGMLDHTQGDQYTHCIHYKVTTVDGLDFCWVPSIYTSIEDLRTPEEQDPRVWIENVVVDQPRDHIKLYEELTGKDLVKMRTPGHNGYELWKRSLAEREKNNGKKYGDTIPKE